jgi:hypothetical protein
VSYWFSLSLLVLVKTLAIIFYRFEERWLSQETIADKPDIRLLILLNHTSLFEPLLVRIAPFWLLKRFAKYFLAPGADVTTQRPFVGRLLRGLLPGMIPISRKRDESWQYFLDQINEHSMVIIMPEGRMRRSNGLDKFGKPMTVRGGVADILQRIPQGKILFVYSGGLHHIQAPGESFPRLFKTIKVNLEIVDIIEYKSQFTDDHFVTNVIQDLQHRLATKTPFCDQQPYNKNSTT